MNFNICVSGYKKTFIDFTPALELSLNELGHKVDKITFGKNPINYIPNEVTIVIEGVPQKLTLSKDSINILFNLEQWKNKKKIEKNRKEFNYIFDIFRYNHQKYNKNSILCPIGYSPVFETNLKYNITNDYFLFGAYTQYRKKWIENNKNKIKYFEEGCYGESRDQNIVNSKINLMIQGHDKWLLPPLHMLLILCKKKFLMMNKHTDYYPYTPDKHFKVFNTLTECNKWLKNDKLRKDFEIAAYEDIKKNHNFTKYLSNALNKINI